MCGLRGIRSIGSGWDDSPCSVGQPGDLGLRKSLGRGETVLGVIGGSRQCGTCTLTCGVSVCVRV